MNVVFYLIAILFCKSHDGSPPFSGCVRGIKHLKKKKKNISFNVFGKKKGGGILCLPRLYLL